MGPWVCNGGGVSSGRAGGVLPLRRPLADQAGSRTSAYDKRDVLAWNVGLDHNQWIRFLNSSNSLTFSAQQFWVNVNGQHTTFGPGVPSVLNDKNVIAGRTRSKQAPVTSAALAATCAPGSGSRAGCSLWNFGGQELLTTLAISTPYLAGNLRPSVVGFFAWSGSWLVQPGVDWTFWDPWRASIRYNYIDGKGNSGIGYFNRKDSIWLELQYLLY